MNTAVSARRLALAPGEFQCEKCSHQPFGSSRGLAIHMAHKHGQKAPTPDSNGSLKDKPRICGKCGQGFTNMHGLHIHEAIVHNVRHAKSVRAMTDKVLDEFSGPASSALKCAQCGYDLEVLFASKQQALYCPGCGTAIKAMVERLVALTKHVTL